MVKEANIWAVTLNTELTGVQQPEITVTPHFAINVILGHPIKKIVVSVLI